MTVNITLINPNKTISMLKRASAWMVVSVSLLLSTTLLAQEARLLSAEFVSLPNQGVELRMEFDTPPATPNSYMIESPPRFVIDINDVTNSSGQRNLSVNTGVVDSVNFAQSQNRLRVVTNLLGTASSDVRMEGNVLVMRFQEAVAVAAPSRAAPVSSPVQQQVADGRTQIQSIDFQRLEGNQGRIIINMNNDRAAMNINREGGNVVLSLSDASLDTSLAKRLDVQDFATPLSFIDSMASGRNVTVLMRPTSEPFDYMAYQTGNQLIVDFKPISQADQQSQLSNLFPFTGERIDLNFQNVEVRAVLQIIAEVADMNLVVSDNVTGTSTLRLKNVPWDQALDILLKSKGLDKREVGNVLMVGTAAEIAERERIEAESLVQEEQVSPLVTEFIQVDFRRASDMRDRIEEARLVSERGFILADDQSNILMVRDTIKKIEEIRSTLRRFDNEVPQILVQARIVEVADAMSRSLGIRWGGGRIGSINGNQFNVGGGINQGNVFNITGSGIDSVSNAMVDFGVGAGSSILAIGYASSSAILAAEISALETQELANVISQPKVVTRNGEEATIKSGQQIGYRSGVDDRGNPIIEFKDVELVLTVTPQINPGDRVSLNLLIEKQTLASFFDGIPVIDSNYLETNITVNDGDTVVLGGVFLNRETNDVSKVPLLGDLPVLGSLFKGTQKTNRKDELLIFITPTMIRESLAIQ